MQQPDEIGPFGPAGRTPGFEIGCPARDRLAPRAAPAEPGKLLLSWVSDRADEGDGQAMQPDDGVGTSRMRRLTQAADTKVRSTVNSPWMPKEQKND